MHIQTDTSYYSEETLKEWGVYTEKWAAITEKIIEIGLALLIGYMVGLIKKEKGERNEPKRL